MKKYIGNFYKRYTWQIQFLFISLLLFGQYILHPTIITHNDTEYFFSAFIFANFNENLSEYIPIYYGSLKIFYLLFYPICSVFNFIQSLVISKTIILICVSLSIFLLCNRLKIDWKIIFLSTFLFNFFGQNLYAGEWIFFK